ncbi:545_t:CDS:2 [Paraglomus occultum]|uniref:Very-long-chain (3R)-3-hydroxyacyl-CoA dehydratase n=1 Tax=Paraglomus occultum TaxID=144539 RepID=A0A9N8ZSM1_9GLOM|nr:545_t:CDS:2 [Paraglomus occultum]
MPNKTRAGSSRTRKQQSGVKDIIDTYLFLYNGASFVAWGCVFYMVVLSLLNSGGDFTVVHNDVRDVLTYVQTGAILEVIHVVLGLVKTPLTTTVIQVTSRLYLVWGILAPFPEVRSHWALTTMTIAWSVTEIVRYLYYGLNIAKIQPTWLLWCRYTFFFVLYPLGAGSESVLEYVSLPYSLEFDKYNIYYYVRIGVLLSYLPGFYTMYTHMIYQRKKYLSKRKIH